MRSSEVSGPRDLFLSYNSTDRDAVSRVRRELSDRKISTFYDRVDLTPGRPWFDELEAALRRVRGAVVFIGKDGLGTVQRREMQFAIARQAIEEKAGASFPVIPVLLEGADPDAISGFLALNTWIDLRRGLENSLAFDSFVKAVHEQPESQKEESPSAICPYRGLTAFREEDSFLFFGREDLSNRLFEQIIRQSFVVMVGRSGSGKSSIAKAGLVPLLRRQKPPADTWEVVAFSPGSRPFHRFAAQLVPLWSASGRDQTDISTESEKLGNRLAAGEVTLASFVDLALKHLPDTSRLIAIVDQFEELFTQASQQEQHRRFVGELISANRESKLTVVLTLRADFYGQAIGLDREFSDLIAAGVLNIGEMTRDELRRAIGRPAELTGVRFEAGLVDRILDHVEKQPGSLPLLEYALTELWQRRQGSQLTHQAYDAIGGVDGAISKRAQAQFEKLTPAQKEIALPALSRLVRASSPGEEGTDTRQLVRLSELSPDAQSVMRIFAESDARLIVAGREETTGEETIEVAHEALIRGWSALKQWIDQDRKFLLWRQQLRPFLEKWRRLGDDKNSALLTGIYLVEARQWLRERPKDLSQEERQFILDSERPTVHAKRRKQVAACTALVAVLAAVGWLWFINRDAYQIQATAQKAREAIVSASESEAEEWLRALHFSGRTSEALAEGKTIGNPDHRAEALGSFALTLAKSGHAAEAVGLAQTAIAASASAPNAKSAAVSYAAAALAKAGHSPEALEALGAINDIPARANAFGRVAKELADTGNMKSLMEFCRRPGNSLVNDRGLAEASRALASSGQIADSVQLANDIKDPIWGSYAKAGVGYGLVASGKTEEAAAIAEEAFRLAQDVKNEPDRSYSLGWVVRALAEAGKTSQALTVAHAIQDETSRDQGLVDIAERLARSGKVTEAIDVAKQVRDALKSFALGSVVSALAQSGRAQQAADAVLLLKRQGYVGTEVFERPVGLGTVVGWLVDSNAKPEDALAIARQIDDPKQRADALASVAETFRRAGKSLEAGKVAEEALANVRHSPKVSGDRALRSHVESLSVLMEVLGNAGISKESAAVATDAQDTARAIADDQEKSQALSAIAMAYAKLHSYRRARLVADQCTSSDDKLSAYAVILREYTVQYHPELAKSGSE